MPPVKTTASRPPINQAKAPIALRTLRVKTVERQPGVGASLPGRLADGAHIVGLAGERHHPRLVIEQGFDRVHGSYAVTFRLPQQIKDQSGIEISGPGAHDHPAGRRQPHGVSTERPSTRAVTLHPLPRWAITMRCGNWPGSV
jgi:hypothetical protein